MQQTCNLLRIIFRFLILSGSATVYISVDFILLCEVDLVWSRHDQRTNIDLMNHSNELHRHKQNEIPKQTTQMQRSELFQCQAHRHNWCVIVARRSFATECIVRWLLWRQYSWSSETISYVTQTGFLHFVHICFVSLINRARTDLSSERTMFSSLSPVW